MVVGGDRSVDQRRERAARSNLDTHARKRLGEFVGAMTPIAILVSAEIEAHMRFPRHVHFLLDDDLFEARQLLGCRGAVAEVHAESEGGHQVLGTAMTRASASSPVCASNSRASSAVFASAMCQKRVSSP